jgi:microcystin-dependent protein
MDQFIGENKLFAGNFALPNLQGTAPMGQDQGPGLTPRVQGSTVGSSTVTLLTTQIPAHNHTANASTSIASNPDPTNKVWGSEGPVGQKPYAATPNVVMNPLALSVEGQTQPHNNMQPYLALNFIIALEGVYPPKSS